MKVLTAAFKHQTNLPSGSKPGGSRQTQLARAGKELQMEFDARTQLLTVKGPAGIWVVPAANIKDMEVELSEPNPKGSKAP